jgi:hypothetical protein
VPGQRQVVRAGRGQVDPAVRGQLRGVDDDPGAGRVGQLHDPAQRRHLAGHVGRPGHRDQRERLALQRVGEPVEGLPDGRRGLQHPPGPPGQQGRVVLEVEPQHRPGDAPGQQVQRVGGVAGEHHDVVLAGPDERGDGVAAALDDGGAHLRGVPGAAVHAGVVRQQFGHVVGDRAQGRGARRQVEVGRAHPLPGDEGDPQVGPHQVGQGGGAGGGQHSGHGSPPDRGLGPGGGRVRACRRMGTAAGSSPGAPHRGGGLPASEPGLGAGALDLFRTYNATGRCVQPP